MLLDLGLVALGLVLLFAGGDALVRGAVALAARLGLPPLLIGLTVVGFGTSMPELLVSLQAAWDGLPDIAVGNVVGSNIANILLILAIAMVLAPMSTRIPGLRRDLAMMMASAVALAACALLYGMNAWIGAGFVLALVAYLTFSATIGRAETPDLPETALKTPVWQSLAFVAGGLVALVFGADFLVEGASNVARALGVSDAVIGLTVVAVGTSLPELAASVAAALRRHPEIALGNVVGSNIFNILGILGVTAMIAPIPIAPQIVSFDIPVMLGVSAALAVLLLAVPRLPRWAGLPLLAAYVWYCAALLA